MGLFGPKKLKEEDYYFGYDYPFVSQPQEDFSPEAFTFGHSYVQFVQLMARDWFGDDPIALRDALKGCKILKGEDVYTPPPAGEVDIVGEPTVDKSLLKSYSRFDGCERISWSKCKIAVKWEKVLKAKGVTVDVSGSPQDQTIEILVGKWMLFDNQTGLPIIGEAWRDKKTGEEFVYWFIDAMCRTRKTTVPPREYPTHMFFLPELLQRAGYLSETIFPSSMLKMRDRMGEFGVEDPAQVPQVAIHVEEDCYVIGIVPGESEVLARIDWAPEVTRYGYILDESIPFDTVDEIVIQLVNALPKVASILADGYANWTFNEQIDFQAELFTDLAFNMDENRVYQVGLNVPGAIYSQQAWRSTISYALLERIGQDPKVMNSHENILFYRGGLFRLVNQGMGAVPVHAVNSLYFKIVNQDDVSQFDSETKVNVMAVLEYFSEWQFDRQDANALSNLSMFQVAWGEFKSALSSAERGIALFKADLTQKFVTDMSGGGPFYPIIIKWELMLTKARVLILLEQPEKAKEPLTALIREARAMQFDGENLHEAEQLLATL
jgi:hypothetical protein